MKTSQNRTPLYTASQTAEFDKIAIQQENIPGLTLMKRAGACAFNALMSTWPDTRKIMVVCGAGNNGGDGYVIARLAQQRNLEVSVLQLGDINKQSDVARHAREEMEAAGIIGNLYDNQDLSEYDLIIDALLGIGLQRELTGDYKQVVEAINQSKSHVVSIDIPSGLHADTGQMLGVAVNADLTVTFIARKQGLYTNDGKTCCGRIRFDALDVPDRVYEVHSPSAYLMEDLPTIGLFSKRVANSHKGDFGHMLVIGGAPGMSGAARMAAVAAMRSGCGLVTVATHPEHANLINSQNPEIMSHGVLTNDQLDNLFNKADVVLLGPGLGTSDWAEQLFLHCVSHNKPLVIDADGLRLLGKKAIKADNWVLTPHPGEAAALLGKTVNEVQANRFKTCRELNNRFGGISVLKGAGSLTSADNQIYLNASGNPGMATAGMGDVLSGIIASFLAQARNDKVAPHELVSAAVYVHGLAGDLAAKEIGERGLMATDLYPQVMKIINQKV